MHEHAGAANVNLARRQTGVMRATRQPLLGAQTGNQMPVFPKDRARSEI
jgi:hypothetical protein